MSEYVCVNSIRIEVSLNALELIYVLVREGFRKGEQEDDDSRVVEDSKTSGVAHNHRRWYP